MSSKRPATFVPGFHDEELCSKMRYNTFGDTGLEVSVLSLGASSLGSVFRSTKEEESIEVVRKALRSGINVVDVAPWYGHGKAETVLGKALKGIPRKAYYKCFTFCRYLPEPDQMFDFSAERTIRSVDESLIDIIQVYGRLGVDYIDIIQIHDMEFADNLDIVINETLPALQKVKEAGKARMIGITGYPLENFRTVLEKSTVKIDSILTYCRGSMNDNSLAEYIPYFESKGIGILNASPISMGLLSDRGAPSWHPASQDLKDTCAAAAAYCKERGVDISRLAMDFTLSQPQYHSTLVSTASLQNLQKNIDSVYTPLSDLEKKTQQEVMEKFMKPLNNKNWEGVEVAEYRASLKSQSG
ncbi:L-galactose dehydrogenase-like [Haliotis rubra]|uniref:L-galactose dehydrogenase-like n=1 Tax=Haliotis rubra TaxID=36100 RepID=UPI001EE5B922|nr:L-galactose dehydrogenase-like [Haliotis rubra]